jgi:TolB-like protein
MFKFFKSISGRELMPLVLVVTFMNFFCARAEQTPKQIVVMQLESKGVEQSLVENVEEVLLTTLQSVEGYQAIGKREIEVILRHQGEKQAAGCVDDSCLTEIGSLVRGDLILTGSVGKVGTALLLSVRLMSVEGAVVVARVSETALDSKELIEAAKTCALKLVKPEKHKMIISGFVLKLDDQKKKMAVLEVRPLGEEKELAQNLTQVVIMELKKIDGLSLISRDEIRSMLSFEQDRQALGCSDESCLAEIGGALGVEYIVTGNVGKLGEAYILNLKLINIRDAKTENRVAESFQGDETQLIGAARFAVRKLLGITGEGDGQLQVRPSVMDSRLFVDGQEIEMREKISLKAGKYNLRLEADGHYPWIGDVYVDVSKETLLDVSLSEMPKPWYKKWWFWTTVGAVVVSSVTFGIVYGLAEDPNTATLVIDADLPGGRL